MAGSHGVRLSADGVLMALFMADGALAVGRRGMKAVIVSCLFIVRDGWLADGTHST